MLRDQAMLYHAEKIGAPSYGLSSDLGLRYRDVGGRIPHQTDLREPVQDKSVHRDVVPSRRALEAFTMDYTVVFPTPVLFLGMHPQTYTEVVLCNAYNSWLTQRILPGDPSLKSMVFLAYNSLQDRRAFRRSRRRDRLFDHIDALQAGAGKRIRAPLCDD